MLVRTSFLSVAFPNISETSLSERRSNLRFIAVLIFAIGLSSAAFVCSHRKPASDDSANPDAPLSLQDSRRDTRELETYNGKIGVLTDKWMGYAQVATQPKPLAIVIVAISGIAAFCIFHHSNKPKQ